MIAVDEMREWFRTVGMQFRSPADLVRSINGPEIHASHEARVGLQLIARALDEVAPYEGDPAVDVAVRFGDVVDALKVGRYTFDSEDGLQRGVEAALVAADLFPVRREVQLSARDRIDHMVGAIGIECKVAGDPDSVRRQLERYADHDQVEALVLVTTRSRHTELLGYVLSRRGRAVPVGVVYLGGQAL